jgi:hypothetical protein
MESLRLKQPVFVTQLIQDRRVIVSNAFMGVVVMNLQN